MSVAPRPRPSQDHLRSHIQIPRFRGTASGACYTLAHSDILPRQAKVKSRLLNEAPTASPAHITEPALFASRAQILWLWIAVLAAALGFCAEVTHYLVATDVGALDQEFHGLSARSHPGCTEQESNYDISCPFPGYNSIQLACGETKCGQRNPNLPPTGPQAWADVTARDNIDRLASRKVEQPYGKDDPEWRNAFVYLSSNARYRPSVIALDRPPRTPEDVAPLIQARQMAAFHDTAQTWMKQHAK